METTTNYKLPQWVKADQIKMDDFNDAFGKIDAQMKKNADKANAAASAESVGTQITAVQEQIVAVASENGFPVFDCVVLGVGADMHTASIFPDTPGLLDSPKVYAACRPQTSKFWRITLTGKALLNSRDTLALLIGESKAPVLKRLEESVQNGDFSTPSAAILGRSKNCTVFASV